MDILNNVRQFSQWLNTRLETAVKSINSKLSIDWSRLVIFGESFGAYLAVYFWTTVKQDVKSSQLRISGLVLRCPLADHYKRDPGLYCGKFVSTQRATHDCANILEVLNNSPLVIRRSSATPPNGMYCAYASSVSGSWANIWNTLSMREMIQTAYECPDFDTMVYVTHGTSDLHVPHTSSVTLCELLRKKWPALEVKLELQEGKGHAWDYEAPLTCEYAKVLTRLCRFEDLPWATTE